MGGWASFPFFCSARAGGRHLKMHAGPGGWAALRKKKEEEAKRGEQEEAEREEAEREEEE